MKQRLNTELIVIHCADTPEDRVVTAADVRRWHLEKMYHDIGYHFFIRKDGTVEKGRSLGVWGAHVFGYNDRSVGVCVAGRGDLSPEQHVALKLVLTVLQSMWPYAPACGHRDLDPHKDCPGFDVESWLLANGFESQALAVEALRLAHEETKA